MVEKIKGKGDLDNPELNKRLEEGLTRILEDARTIAEAPHTKSEKRDSILALCENAEDVLEDLTSAVKYTYVNYLCWVLVLFTILISRSNEVVIYKNSWI